MQRILMACLIVAVLVAGLGVMMSSEKNGLLPYVPSHSNDLIVRVGETPFKVRLADTPDLRAHGLSGKNEPPHAMLFVFDQNDRWGIWMKDMHFAIDVLWVDETRRVTHIETNLLPASYPQVYRPKDPVRYVLELPANYVEQYNLRVGDSVQW